MASPRISNQETGLDAIEGLPVLLHHRLYLHPGETFFSYNSSVSGLGSAQALGNEVRAGLLQRQSRTALLRRLSRSSTSFKRRKSFWEQADVTHGQVLVLPLTPLNHSCLQLRGQVKQIHYSKSNIAPSLHLHGKYGRLSSSGQRGVSEQVDGDMQTQRISVISRVESFKSDVHYQPPKTAPIRSKISSTSCSDSGSQRTDFKVSLSISNNNHCKVPYRLQSLHSKPKQSRYSNAKADIKKSESSPTHPCHQTSYTDNKGFNGKTEYTQDERTLTLSVFLPSEGIITDRHISAEDATNKRNN